jgi:glycosyltransferase involved in cell wall biosynthesis
MKRAPDATRRILFVGHEASRTGAPVMLLHLLRWLQTTKDMAFEVLLQGGGALLSEYRGVGPVQILDRYRGLDWTPGGYRLSETVMKWHRTRLRRRLHEHFDLLYLNSTVTLKFLDWLGTADVPVVLHAHELDLAAGPVFRDPERLTRYRRALTRVIACSGAVREYFTERLGFDRERVDVAHEFIETDRVQACARSPAPAEMMGLRLPNDAFIVGGLGTISFRKGPDLFVQLAERVAQKLPGAPIHFVWPGSVTHAGVAEFIKGDAVKLGVADRVHFLGEQENPWPVVRRFDVLAMLSREDPYPLACLEAGVLGVPVLCFDKAGGTPELIADGRGRCVPYMDVDAAAEVIAELYRSPEQRRELGKRLQEFVLLRHGVSQGAGVVMRSVALALEEARGAASAATCGRPVVGLGHS